MSSETCCAGRPAGLLIRSQDALLPKPAQSGDGFLRNPKSNTQSLEKGKEEAIQDSSQTPAPYVPVTLRPPRPPTVHRRLVLRLLRYLETLLWGWGQGGIARGPKMQ